MSAVEIRPNSDGGWHVYVDGTDIAADLTRLELTIDPDAIIPTVTLTLAPGLLDVTIPDAALEHRTATTPDTP